MPLPFFAAKTIVLELTVSTSAFCFLDLGLLTAQGYADNLFCISLSWACPVEVYPRPDGSVYICGIGGSDYISTEDLKKGAFREVCDANTARVDAAKQSFQAMSAVYKDQGQLDRVQACMRPCAPDAMPYMGRIPGYVGAYCNCAHNCWGIAWAPACGQAMSELVWDGASTSIQLAPFDPARFTPDAQRGGRGRKKQGSNVGEQW